MNTVPNFPARTAVSLTQITRQSLLGWANSLSNDRLETLRQQLIQAFACFKPGIDDRMSALVFEFRFAAVTDAIRGRGGVPEKTLICIPWGKSIDTTATWTLTDFTQLQQQQLPSEPKFLPVFQSGTQPLGDLSGPEKELFTNMIGTHDEDLLDYFLELSDGTMQAMDNVATEADENNFIDQRNDVANRTELFRLADNDFSGLPIVSSEVIDIGNVLSPLDGLIDIVSDDFPGAQPMPQPPFEEASIPMTFSPDILDSTTFMNWLHPMPRATSLPQPSSTKVHHRPFVTDTTSSTQEYQDSEADVTKTRQESTVNLIDTTDADIPKVDQVKIKTKRRSQRLTDEGEVIVEVLDKKAGKYLVRYACDTTGKSKKPVWLSVGSADRIPEAMRRAFHAARLRQISLEQQAYKRKEKRKSQVKQKRKLRAKRKHQGRVVDSSSDYSE